MKAAQTAKAYEALLKALSVGVKAKVQELAVPPVKVISVSGKEPPAARPYQDAIAVLYGIGYTLKMGLKFGKLARPSGYFDYKVGALETLWWSTGKTFDISNAKTLRWQAYLMVPDFVSAALVGRASVMAAAKRPDIPYNRAEFGVIDEGRSIQVRHLGPYDQEQPTIEILHDYMAAHGLTPAGKHHEIYISDPRRTSPGRLKTVIRIPVRDITK